MPEHRLHDVQAGSFRKRVAPEGMPQPVRRCMRERIRIFLPLLRI
jgi:hypothetical protein